MEMEKDCFNKIDLSSLNENLKSFTYLHELSLNLCNYKIDNIEYNEQINNLFKISQVLLKFILDNYLDILENKSKIQSSKTNKIQHIHQCTNCSKAFTKIEYLESHFQRRHAKKSLAENGVLPLIKQIQNYNSALFVDSSCINDLKEEFKKIQLCLHEKSKELEEEKLARERLQKLIEIEIVNKLNLIQQTWTVEKNKNIDLELKIENQNQNLEIQRSQQLNYEDEHKFGKKNQNNKTVENEYKSKVNELMVKQIEVVDKLGKHIEKFINNFEKQSKEEHLKSVLTNVIQNELINLNEKKTNKLLKKIENNKLKKKITDESDNTLNEDLHNLSLHEFSTKTKFKSDDIISEIDQIIKDEIQPKSNINILKNKFKGFKFKFKTSKNNSSQDDLSENLNKKLEQSYLKEENESCEKEHDEKIFKKLNNNNDEKILLKKNDFNILNNNVKIENKNQIQIQEDNHTEKNDLFEVDYKNILKNENIQIMKPPKAAPRFSKLNKLNSDVNLKSVLKKNTSLNEKNKIKKKINFSDEKIEISPDEYSSSNSDV